ncbi:MAG: tetratricopeptide repeat protein [Deltaproteobacteria bacterium]|nr:tetratricopeptide repeat protein [Deltaproteobacteria bacterium]
MAHLIASELIETLTAEVEHSKSCADQELMRVQLALLCQDLEQDTHAAEAWLGDHHSGYNLLTEIKRQFLMARGELEATVDLLQRSAHEPSPFAATPFILHETALLQLYGLGDAAGAAHNIRQALDDESAFVLEHALLRTLRLALWKLGDFHSLAQIRGVDDADAFTCAAIVARDRLANDELAIELLDGALQTGAATPVTIEFGLELAVLRPDRVDEARLTKLKRALLHEDAELEQAKIDQHNTPLNQRPPDLRERVIDLQLLFNSRSAAVQAQDQQALAAVYQALARDSDCPSFASVYRLRAAQLLNIVHPKAPSIDAMLNLNMESRTEEEHSAMLLERRLLIANNREGLAAHYERHASCAKKRAADLLRRASLLVEVVKGPRARVHALREQGLSLASDAFGGGDRQRFARESSREELLSAYLLGSLHAEKKLERILWPTMIASLQLLSGDTEAAEANAKAALVLAPKDRLALLLLTIIARHTKNKEAEQEATEQLLEALEAPQSRAHVLRALATLSPEPAQQIKLLEQMRASAPDAGSPMIDLAHLYRKNDRLEEALKIYERCTKKAKDLVDRATAHRCAAELMWEDQARIDDAYAHFHAAIELDGTNSAARRGLCKLLEREERNEELVEELRHLVESADDMEARSAALYQLGRALDLSKQTDEAIEAYADSLMKNPQHEESLMAIHDLAWRESRWDYLNQQLVHLPLSAAILELRAEALEHLDRTNELLQVRMALLDSAVKTEERAHCAHALGGVYERLGETEAASDHYRLAIKSSAEHQPSYNALRRLHRAAGNLPAVLDMLDAEATAIADPQERAILRQRAADLAEELGEMDRARAYLVQLVALDPMNVELLDRLEHLYGDDHPEELADLLFLRGKYDENQHSAHYLRAGALLTSAGLPERASQAYRDAVLSAPNNREAFATYERHIYEKHAWRDALELYDLLIQATENQDLKAYRLSDLYYRRGRLQHNKLGQSGEAAASLYNALRNDPKSEGILQALTAIFVEEQDWAGLIRTYEQRAELLPGNQLFRLESLRQAARLASSRLPGESNEPQRLWKEVRVTDPFDAEALEALVAIYRKAGPASKLAETLEAHIEIIPESESASAIDLRLELARVLEFDLDDPRRAGIAYERVIAIEEHHEEALNALARIYEATEQWDRCIEALNGLIMLEADPEERSLLYFKCGSIAEARSKDDLNAVQLYRRALEESDGCLPAIHGLRDIYLRHGDWKMALDTLEVEFGNWVGSREQAGVLARMGQILSQRMHDPESAMQRFEGALRLDPQSRPALQALFAHHYDRGEHLRALQLAERLAERLADDGDPEERSTFYLQRGALLLEIDDNKAAAESFVAALESTPENIEVLDALISLCREAPSAHDFATVFRRLEQVYRQGGNTEAVAHVLIAAGALAEQAGDAETALARYEEAMDQAPLDLAPAEAHASLLFRLSLHDAALEELKAFIARADDVQTHIEALLRLAELYDHLDRPEEAATILERGLELAPWHLQTRLRLAQEYYVLERLDSARAVLEDLLAKAQAEDIPLDQTALFHYYLGTVEQRIGAHARAESSYRKALELMPAFVPAAIALAHRLVEGGDRRAAEDLLENALQRVGRRGESALQLRRAQAGIAAGGGDIDAAVRVYEAIKAEGSAELDDQVLLASLYARRKGGVSRAIRAVEDILEVDIFNPHALPLLAALHESGGESDRTLQVLRVARLLGLCTEDDEAQLDTLLVQYPWVPRRPIDDRTKRLLGDKPPPPHLSRLWALVGDELARIFPLGIEGEPTPIEKSSSGEVQRAAADVLRLFACDLTVHSSPSLKIPAVVDKRKRGRDRLLLSTTLLDRPRGQLLFALGRAVGMHIDGHSMLDRLSFEDRQLLVELLGGLLRPSFERTELAEEFLRRLPESTITQIDEIAASHHTGNTPEQAMEWDDAVNRRGAAYGLVASDDIAAAIEVLRWIGGSDHLSVPLGETAVRAAPYGSELLHFYLSESYLQLRRRLSTT